MEQPHVGPADADRPADALDRWAAFLGTTLTLASLGLVALADFGWLRPWLALLAVILAALCATALWRPPLRLRPTPSVSALLAIAILAVGAALVAPGSENIAGPRDQAVYVATGFALASGGSTIVHDAALRLLAENTDTDGIDAWIYRNAINGARIRFPAQLFIHDVDAGTVEGGFLPVLPVWIALAASLGGIEPALHVAGVFGMLALGLVMLASHATHPGGQEPGTPVWPLVGAILAISFSQVWWAREPMAESALGAFTWLCGWACIRWLAGGGRRWATLAGLAAACALFTRADGVLLAAALALIAVRFGAPGRRWLFMVLVPGVLAAGLHYALLASVYTSTVYGEITLSRAVFGVAAVVILGGLMLAAPRLSRWAPASGAMTARRLTAVRRAAVLGVLGLAMAAAISGIAPGVGRAPGLGAASPLAWLPGYVPWPILGLAALGVVVWAWNGVPRPVLPLVLFGGLPALLYLPDPLVTGDHPWMVRRLVPAVIPLLAIAASVGALALWRLRPDGRLARFQVAAPVAAAILVGSGLGLAVAQDRDLVGARHGAGVLSGLTALASDLPGNALVVFPGDQAGIHLAMPLEAVFGVDSFVVPARAVVPEIASTLARMEAAGRAAYWVEDGGRPPILPDGVTVTPYRTARVHYRVADNGPVPPPLQLRDVDHALTLYRLSFTLNREE